jgi:hypothetical protein
MQAFCKIKIGPLMYSKSAASGAEKAQSKSLTARPRDSRLVGLPENGVLFENSIVCLVVFVCCFLTMPRVFPFVGCGCFFDASLFGVFCLGQIVLNLKFCPVFGWAVFVWRV